MHEAVAFGQADLDHDLHPLQQFVVGRGQQGPVEVQVGLDGAGQVAVGGLHGVEGGVQGGEVVGVRRRAA